MSNEQSNQKSSFKITDFFIIVILCINVFFLYKFFEISRSLENIKSSFPAPLFEGEKTEAAADTTTAPTVDTTIINY